VTVRVAVGVLVVDGVRVGVGVCVTVGVAVATGDPVVVGDAVGVGDVVPGGFSGDGVAMPDGTPTYPIPWRVVVKIGRPFCQSISRNLRVLFTVVR
jgi:hypothetical protein